MVLNVCNMEFKSPILKAFVRGFKKIVGKDRTNTGRRESAPSPMVVGYLILFAWYL